MKVFSPSFSRIDGAGEKNVLKKRVKRGRWVKRKGRGKRGLKERKIGQKER
jgi:hypothetical protein